MADRFPLIVDSANNNIKELPSGDNLDLTGNNIVNVANVTLTGYLAGPATFTIDPAAVGDNTGLVVIAGDLQVDGTTTTINSTTVAVDDKNLTLASGAINASAADGAGFTIDGASATFTYVATGDNFALNKSLDVTGTVTADGLTVDGSTTSKTISGSTAAYSGINYTNTTANKTYRVGSDESGNFKVRNTTDNRNAIQIESNNDISFYEDTGTTVKFFWDASAEALGLGTTTPATTLEVRRDDGTTSGPAYSAPLRLTNGEDWGWGVGLEFAQPASGPGGAIEVTGAVVSNYDSADNFSLRFWTLDEGTMTEGMRLDNGALVVESTGVAKAGMPIVTNSTTSRTFAIGDNGKYIRTTNAAATTVTIPPNSSVAFPVGAEIVVFQAGAGTVTFAAGAGVTINSKDSALSISAQYAAATCKKVATDTWDLIGDLA